MTKNILILFALVLLASTSNWVPLYTDGTLTGGGYEDSPLGVDTSKVATTYDLMSAAGGASYDVYTAIIYQSGTGAPTATVLENTLGGTVVYSYTGAGSYRGTLTDAFTVGKTLFEVSPQSVFELFNIEGIILKLEGHDAQNDAFNLYSDSQDDWFNGVWIRITVYP